MGYSSERGAASRNLLRARAQGHKDAIADAETLARAWLGHDYGEDGGDEMEEYIAAHYADFIPEPPEVNDEMVGRAHAAVVEHLSANAGCVYAEDEGPDMLRTALEAALNPGEER